MDLAPDEQDQIVDLINQVRHTRLEIATKRFAQTRVRYPEVAHTEVTPLTDGQVLIVSLQRELHHVEATIKNMHKDD